MLRQTCLLSPDQAAGDSVAALSRWYGESIDEILRIRITVRQMQGMNRLGALARHQASINGTKIRGIHKIGIHWSVDSM